MTEPPEISLGSGETGAVDTGLLTGTNTNDSATVGIGNTVGLSVLEGEGSNDQVGESLSGELSGDIGICRWKLKVKRMTNLLVFGDDVFEQLCVDLGIVAALLEVNTVNLAGLDLGRGIVRVHLRTLSISIL